MAERRLNELIALELGWKPPDSPECRKRMETAPLLAGFAGTWLKPDGNTLEHLPRFDTDWAATGVLLEDVRVVSLDSVGGEYTASICLCKDGPTRRATRPSLTDAIAKAWLAAKEAGRDG